VIMTYEWVRLLIMVATSVIVSFKSHPVDQYRQQLQNDMATAHMLSGGSFELPDGFALHGFINRLEVESVDERAAQVEATVT
ncbi:hypothetical protein PENTCL1PPCAC_9700, partial [Pristionchus entomophagus]